MIPLFSLPAIHQTTRTATLFMLVVGSTISAWAGDPAASQLSPLLEEPASKDIWDAELGLNLWAASLSGVSGAGGFVAPIDLSFGDIFDNLDFAIMGSADIRKRGSRLGFLFEGSYIKLGPSIDDVPLPFFTIDDIEIEQVMASAAISYRLFEWERGYFDVFGGARYMYVSNELGFSPDSAGIASTSSAISTAVTSEISNRAAAAVAEAKPIVISELQNAARVAIISGIADGSIDPEKINPGTIALVRAIAAEKAAAIGSAARKKASKAVAKLEKRLARELQNQITDAVPASVGGSADWIDPLVGMRAKHFIAERVYLAALADVGGFGVGSELSWNVGGGIGVQLRENVALEVFYRYMSIDYDDDILLDVDMNGLFLGAKLQF